MAPATFAGQADFHFMADPRLSVSPVPAPSARASVPAASETVRAAQRAFFDAALRQAPTEAKSLRTADALVSGGKPGAVIGAAATAAEPPSRSMRAGSIVDIRV